MTDREKGGVAKQRTQVARRSALLRILASGALALSAQNVLAQVRKAAANDARPAQTVRTAELPQLRDLAADAAASARERKPLLLFFDREQCPFCERALREYLVPFSRDEWKDRALFRQVAIDRTLPVRDLDGTVTTHQALAERYQVSLSPTVLIVDPRGRPIGSPIVGLLTVDFYGAYIDNALADAAAKLRR